jgi:GTPase SAR1 family protein/Leucine-rich repeat (LRR) protein
MPDDEKAIPIPNSGRAEAVRRIRECEKTGQTWLDLGDLALEELPPELGQLTHLRHLALGKERCDLDIEDRIKWIYDKNRPTQALTDLSSLVKLSALTTLSLSGCESVSDLGPLQTLTGLNTLYLSWCKSVSDLGPLRTLTGLNTLHLSWCESVSDLGPLQTLTGLNTLVLKGCALLPDLGQLRTLTGLTWLDLSLCKLVSDLEPLRTLTGLTCLELFMCKLVSDLSPLRTLTRLTNLNLYGCMLVSDLEPLRPLTELSRLILDFCKPLSDLTPLLDLAKLQHLDVLNTAVPLPDHLRDSFDASAIMAWYRENKLATGKRPLAEVKLLLVGQGRVGKTQLRLRFFDGMGIAHHDPTLESTKHIDYTEATHTLPENHRTKFSQVKLRVWDFGGQNELHSSHRFFLGSQRCFYILVLAADRPANGESSDSNRLNYWLRVIAEYGRRDKDRRAPVLIVVTRSDVERAKSYREEMDEAVETARKYDWFGAHVVEVVRGLGWSRGLSETTHKAIWERHEAAAKLLDAAINAHLATVIDLDQEISPIYHAAKAFVEKAFSKERSDDDSNLRTCLAGDDLKRFAELFEQSKAQKTEEEREGLRRDCLGLLNSLGVVHWVGDMPEIDRQNRWNLRDIAFNPEWVRRPVYDLIRCGDTDSDRAGFLPDQQVRIVLAERQCGNPDATDLYDQLPFRREDRARVLELMKACRLVFDLAYDDRAEGGLLVPDLLRATSLPDENAPVGTWMVRAQLLPEKVFLRFIARHYDAIDHHAGRCFRNQVAWRTESESVLLEAHYSPPGATLPYVLIRSEKPKQSLPETVAATVQALFDEIYKEERLSHVRRELTKAGKPSRLRANGPYVFRCEILELPKTRNRDAKMVPKFTIWFNGVELDFPWRSLKGLGYLYRLIRQPGELIPVGDFFRAERSDAAKGYKFRQEGAKLGSASASLPRPSPKFAEYSTKKLKQLCKAAELKLEQEPDSETEQRYARRVQELTDEIDRRSNPELKTGMRSVQAELRKAVNELKARMKEKKIPEEHWGHFDHCASSAEHEFHFRYEKPTDIAWDTD